MSASSERRVITFLPPPLVPQAAVEAPEDPREDKVVERQDVEVVEEDGPLEDQRQDELENEEERMMLEEQQPATRYQTPSRFRVPLRRSRSHLPSPPTSDDPVLHYDHDYDMEVDVESEARVAKVQAEQLSSSRKIMGERYARSRGQVKRVNISLSS